MSLKLFAVCLGGRAPKCNTELHDVVFAVGEDICSTYEQLMGKWFGAIEGLHIDSWFGLDIVDGHRITIAERRPDPGKNLYFINLGAYADGVFGELHANHFLVAGSAREAKARAKVISSKTLPGGIHTDDLLDVDECILLQHIGPYHITLQPTAETGRARPVNGYHIIPKSSVENYLTQNRRTQ